MAGTGSGLDTELTAAALAAEAQISPATLGNWRSRTEPLAHVVTSDGQVRFTWRQLLEFCERNPGLRAVDKVRRHAPGQAAAARPAAHGDDVESLRSIARDARAAAAAHLEALVAAARQAEETERRHLEATVATARHAEEMARRHREQLEQMAAAYRALDGSLIQLTSSRTPHD